MGIVGITGIMERRNLMTFRRWVVLAVLCAVICAVILPVQALNLFSAQDVQAMRSALNLSNTANSSASKPSRANSSTNSVTRFQHTFNALQEKVDKQLLLPVDVPVPADAGGGYTHEQHKRNYQLMYNAGLLFVLTQEQRYADFTRDMLLQYAALYPTLPRHPKRKSSNEGKLFWQGLNEAVWLVYTIQAYDFIRDALSGETKATIEQGVFTPVAMFLSKESPHTFNKVHNHGTWANAAVGMTGYVLGKQQWVEWALLDLQLSGKGGFLRQLDTLFSPGGYYTEGPYYQRYALMPFVTFAKAIEANEPERKIFEYRDGILLKAIETTIELSYNGLFFPLNDAIKSKGINTIELVNGVALAYRLTGEARFLDIAQQQNIVLLSGDGLAVSRAIQQGKAEPYVMPSRTYGDGKSGKEGALVVMRHHVADEPVVVYKATSQGLGHGHFDKLTWQFYDRGAEIVSDYGAARFLNVETKAGGRYLPENKTYAKQTVAHNTLVVDEQSHFNASTKTGNKFHPTLNFAMHQPNVSFAHAAIDTAYKNVSFNRTLAMVTTQSGNTFVIDKLNASANSSDNSAQPRQHQFDLPLHYQGQITHTTMPLQAQTTQMQALGKQHGYEHLWVRAKANIDATKASPQISWLNDNGKFYTLTLADNQQNSDLFFTLLGAGDPNFNLRSENALIIRKHGNKAEFLSVLEPHGEYNPAQEYTAGSTPSLLSVSGGVSQSEPRGVSESENGSNNILVHWVRLTLSNGSQHLLAYRLDSQAEPNQTASFSVDDQQFSLTGQVQFFENSHKRG